MYMPSNGGVWLYTSICVLDSQLWHGRVRVDMAWHTAVRDTTPN